MKARRELTKVLADLLDASEYYKADYEYAGIIDEIEDAMDLLQTALQELM